jgi:hypothetical protein
MKKPSAGNSANTGFGGTEVKTSIEENNKGD